MTVAIVDRLSRIKSFYVGKRKHYTQMTDFEKAIVMKRFNAIKHWSVSSHTHIRINQKNIPLDSERIIKMMKNADIIEYKIDERSYGLDERIVLRSRGTVLNRDNVCVVFSLTQRKVITVWVNKHDDNHATIDMSAYDSEMIVFA